MRKLNLGCGFDLRDGYINLDFQDFHRPNVVADVRRLPFSTRAGLAEVLAVDVLEHLARAETAAALNEWVSLLGPRGVLALQLPDLRGLARQILSSPGPARDDQLAHLYYGTQAYTGDYHLAGFTDASLAAHLWAAGCRWARFWEMDDWLLRVEAGIGEPDYGIPRFISLTDGFFGKEVSKGGDSWYWARQEAALRLVNPTTTSVSVQLSCRVGTHDQRGGRVVTTTPQGEIGMDADCAGLPAVLRLDLPPGVTTLEMRSTVAPISRSRDARPLSFFLSDLEVLPGGANGQDDGSRHLVPRPRRLLPQLARWAVSRARHSLRAVHRSS